MTISKLSWPLIFLALYVATFATIDSATAQSPDDILNEAAKKAAEESQKEIDQIYDQWIKSHPEITPECASEYNKTVTEFVNSIFNQMVSPDYMMTSSTNMTAYVEDWATEAEKNLTRCVDKSGGSYNSGNVLGFDYNVHFVVASFVSLLFLFV